MSYNHNLYLKNCKKMIDLNEEQVANVRILMSKEKDPDELADLQMELDGWMMWLKTWKDRLAVAEKAEKNRA